MTGIKICGLKRYEDIDYINDLMPEYAGFVFAASKRYVPPSFARELRKKLHSSIKAVGVFVDEDPSIIKAIVKETGIDIVQLHGHEDINCINSLNGIKLWKAVGIESSASYNKAYNLQDNIDRTCSLPIDAILLDSSVMGICGGTGVSIDRSIVSSLHIGKPLILAGGLSAENVGEAIEDIRPFAVDVSSNVETDGSKDYSKIRKFIKKVRE